MFFPRCNLWKNFGETKYESRCNFPCFFKKKKREVFRSLSFSQVDQQRRRTSFERTRKKNYLERQRARASCAEHSTAAAMPKKGKGKKKSKKDSEPTEPPHDPGWERVSASSGTFRKDKHWILCVLLTIILTEQRVLSSSLVFHRRGENCVS